MLTCPVSQLLWHSSSVAMPTELLTATAGTARGSELSWCPAAHWNNPLLPGAGMDVKRRGEERWMQSLLIIRSSLCPPLAGRRHKVLVVVSLWFVPERERPGFRAGKDIASGSPPCAGAGAAAPRQPCICWCAAGTGAAGWECCPCGPAAAAASSALRLLPSLSAGEVEETEAGREPRSCFPLCRTWHSAGWDWPRLGRPGCEVWTGSWSPGGTCCQCTRCARWWARGWSWRTMWTGSWGGCCPAPGRCPQASFADAAWPRWQWWNPSTNLEKRKSLLGKEHYYRIGVYLGKPWGQPHSGPGEQPELELAKPSEIKTKF